MRALQRLRTLADRNWAVWLTLAALAAVLTLPLCLNGFLTGHDHPFHLKWSHHFSAEFWAGEAYPRWLTGMNAGQGSPVFFFYGPLEYWITAMLPPWSGHTLEATARQLGYSAWLAVLVSGVAFFAWIRRHVGRAPALVAAAVYLILPYHVVADVYMRFAFAEFWCFAWMPLVLLSADRLIHNERYGFAGFATSYALMLMTHLPSTLIFSAIPALYLLAFAPAPSRVRTLALAAGAYALGALLAAVYVLPAMTMQNAVGMPAVLWSGAYDAWNNFLFYGPRFHDDPKDAELWRWLTRITLLTGAVGVLAGALAWNKDGRKPLLFWGATMLLALFMTHPWSNPIWKAASVLHAVQFPWRFNLAATLAAAALCAFGLQALFERFAPWRAAVAGVIAIGLAVPWALNAHDMLRHLRQPFHPYAGATMNHFDPDEYRPVAVPPAEWAKLREGEIETAGVKLASVDNGEGSVTLVSQEPRDIRLRVSVAREATIVIRQFDFVGWEATLDGERPVPIEPSKEGWLRARVPPGEHELRVQLTALPLERAGRWISAAALAALLASLLVPAIARRKAAQGPGRATPASAL